jgi:hypothetical protein
MLKVKINSQYDCFKGNNAWPPASFCLPFFYHGEIIILNYKKIKEKNKKNLQSQYFLRIGSIKVGKDE